MNLLCYYQTFFSLVSFSDQICKEWHKVFKTLLWTLWFVNTFLTLWYFWYSSDFAEILFVISTHRFFLFKFCRRVSSSSKFCTTTEISEVPYFYRWNAFSLLVRILGIKYQFLLHIKIIVWFSYICSFI